MTYEGEMGAGKACSGSDGLAPGATTEGMLACAAAASAAAASSLADVPEAPPMTADRTFMSLPTMLAGFVVS
jgi:hypothetical protein